MQFPSFAPVSSNQGAVKFTVNTFPSDVINYTKSKDDFYYDKLLARRHKYTQFDNLL